MTRLVAELGDITKLEVDAIVNAANESLLGGGGVDGAIHRAAGPGLLSECRALSGCSTGQAKITQGYKLPAKFIIHTVGPVWRGGGNNEAELLASCYRESLKLAAKYKFKRLAFPSISTGVYGYPIEQAVDIAITTVSTFLGSSVHDLECVIFCCFSESDLNLYQSHLSALNQDEMT